MTDQQLLAAYISGRDVDCLGHLCLRYEQSLLRFVGRLLGDPEMAQDVVQEAFLEVARHPRRLTRVENCHNWLLRVVRNLGMTHLRRVARQRKHVAAVARQAPVEPAGVAPEAVLEADETRAEVHAALTRLPTRQRELLLLRVQENKSYREIAEITGLTATNVGYLLHQALRTLGRQLAPRHAALTHPAPHRTDPEPDPAHEERRESP